MCGIAGAVWTDRGEPLARDVLGRMTGVLRHRGPDDDGEYVSHLAMHGYTGRLAGAALGFRRLSIIDLAGGHQPLANEDETVWLVFNGEIYNFRTLHRRLTAAGHRFRTASDSETIVHLYEDEGLDFLKRLEGMFALALWDSTRRRLVLARDRLGKKPLVYRHEGERLLFASELKAILQVPGVPRDIDPAAVDEFLAYQYVPHPNTIFRGIRKLPPAHYAVFDGSTLQVEAYWRPDFNLVDRRSYRDHQALLRERLTAAVEKRLQSDVPLGAFLSGGVDSSIVAGLMSRLMKEPVRTFSIGFPVPEYDETSYARQVAASIGSVHQEFRVEPSAVEVLPKLAWHYDEPFSDSSAIPTYYVSRLTREQVTVALTGDGGDELFAGYDRYKAVRLGSWIDACPAAWRRALAAAAGRLPDSGKQRSFSRRLKRLLSALAEPPQRRYMNWVCIFNEARRADLYTDQFVAQLPDSDPFDFLGRAFARASGRDQVTAASVADLLTYLPCDLLVKVDIASMANSLECRQPFLDHLVVEQAMSMPVSYKLRGRRAKRILVDTFADVLPLAVRTRPKMGFGVPLASWFRNELAGFTRDVLLAPVALQRGLFRPEAVRRLVDEHRSGRFDHSYRLWALLTFEMWWREWAGPPQSSGETRQDCRSINR